jgi:hypothetical protein
MVEELTLRELSFASDLLPAISGIASRFSQLQNDIYLAGIWRNDLAQGLLRRTAHGDYAKHSRRHDRYFAPSWSWASVTGEISYEYRPDGYDWTSDLEIINIVCVARGKNPFGHIRNAYLEVIGLIAPAKAYGLPPEGDPYHKTISNIKRRMLSGKCQ